MSLYQAAKRLVKETACLLRSIPSTLIAFLCLTVVLMNLFASKSISGLPPWLGLDCGFLLSWEEALCEDTVAKRFGPRASVLVSLFAVGINLVAAGLMTVAAIIPGAWSASLDHPEATSAINDALNATIASTWFIVLGSVTAYIVSSFVDAFANWGLRTVVRHDNFLSFIVRSWGSTLVSQFVDNCVFAFIVSYSFFGWSVEQCLWGALIGMLFELLCEVVFSPWAFAIVRSWEKNDIGTEYLTKYFRNDIHESYRQNLVR